MRNFALILGLIALLCVAAPAQDVTLKIAQTATDTTFTVDYVGTAPLGKLPQLVFLGSGLKAGTTKFEFSKIPFITNDLIFALDKAMFLPIGRLDAKGNLVVKYPFGPTGAQVYKLYFQAAVLKLNFDIKSQGFPLKGTFLTSKVSTEVAIGMGKAKP